MDEATAQYWADTATSALRVVLEQEAEKLNHRSTDELMAAYQQQLGISGDCGKPTARAASTTAFDRNPLVLAIAKQRADHKCEVPACGHPIFLGKNGKPYYEVQVIPLTSSGTIQSRTGHAFVRLIIARLIAV